MVPNGLSELVKRFEGFARVVQTQPVVMAVPYLCPANYWTIGYGERCDKNHPPITEAQGEERLVALLPLYVANTISLSPKLLLGPDCRLAALADFVFNLGATRYSASTLRRRVNDEDWPGAAEQIHRWVWGGGRKLPGLILRRRAEAELLLRDE